MQSHSHWAIQVANAVEEHVRRTKGESAPIVCASGISPSGPIHLGNLREVTTVHFVSEELRRRGRAVRHIHSWDDFDRLRKVPEGVDESFTRYIGQPLSEVPDPKGEYKSYAARHMIEFERSLERLAIRPEYIRQSVAYRRGDYTPEIKTALAARHQLFDILEAFQTPGRQEKPREERREGYWPFRVYCEACHHDSTEMQHYDPLSSEIRYTCSHCSHKGAFRLDEKVPGKLVWKVDWPMRWSKEGVDFEPGGEDHSSPMSSAAVGRRVVREVYGKEPPHYVGYAFVGMAGRSKISSSAGTTAVPATALEIFEPGLLRWQYFRRNVAQKFDVYFGGEVVRLYDEWDSLGQRVAANPANEKDRFVLANSLETTAGRVEATELRVPFRILSSAADITQGNLEQMLRIVGEHLEDPPDAQRLRTLIEPRLSCALHWATQFLPEDERTAIRQAFDPEVGSQVSAEHRRGIRLLLDRMEDQWSLPGLTVLIYGVPKLLAGLPLDAPADEALKQSQRAFFATLYLLLCSSDTGPRLPTLFLSLGKERIRHLLEPAAEPSPGAIGAVPER
jgi:lysyl-tRNA synthetase class 1